MRGIFHSRFACTVTVTDSSGSRSARAFLRPASLTAPELPELSPAGVLDGRRWRIILEPLELTGQVTVTTDDGTEYLLLRREIIGGGDHIEGLLCRKAGESDAG